MIQPAAAQADEVPKGLEGVVVADTTVGDVRGLEGFYHYRQYSAVDLAQTRPLEDVWYLMFNGRLPTTLAEREEFAAEIRARRTVPADVAAPPMANAFSSCTSPCSETLAEGRVIFRGSDAAAKIFRRVEQVLPPCPSGAKICSCAS